MFKDKSSCISLPTVVIERTSSLVILFAYFRLFFVISCFVLTVLGQSGGDLADILPRVIRVYHLYTIALETVLLSLP